MKNFSEKLESILAPVASKIASNRYINAIQAGFLTSMPLVVVASILVAVACLPIDGFQAFMASTFGANWTSPLFMFGGAATDIIGIFVLVGASASLAKYYKLPIASTVGIAISGFIVINGNVDSLKTLFGSTNLFLVLITSVTSVEIIKFVKDRNWTIKMPDSVPEAVSASFAALIPGLAVVLIYVIIYCLFSGTSFGTPSAFINQIVQTPITKLGATLPAVLVFILFEIVLWSFGIHGSNIVGAIFEPIFTILTLENLAATNAGLAPTNIFALNFYTNFVRLGGAGANLGLLVCMLVFAKSERYKSLGKLATAPLVFQINEPIIFGFPLVMNPIMDIPFILAPMVNAILTYIAMSTGIVPCCNGISIPWNTPPIISGFLLCGWRGSLLQLVCLAVNIVIWLPFFKVFDKQAYLEETTGK